MTRSKNINELTPGFAIHPGEYLADELNSRQISQKEFAIQLGIATSQFNEVIKGKRNLTAEMALLIGKSLDMEPSIWLNLQANYELDLAKIQEKTQLRFSAIDTWNHIKDSIPVAFFKQQKIITGDPVLDLPIIKSVYNVQHTDQIISKYSEPRFALHRKSEKLETDKINLLGWEQLIIYKASQIKVNKFDARNNTDLITGLKSVFVKNKNTVQHTETLLSKYGIKLIVLPTPSKCAIDGFAFWSNGNPAIGLSLRHSRIDNFSFTLMHELGHVYLHLTSDNRAQFLDIENQKMDDKEKEANEFASNNLIPNAEWKEFKADYIKPSDADFVKLAKKNHLHPAIVLGRYSHEQNKFNIRTSIDKNLN
ncbi:MAG: HigA family addiction module antidote protein [Bacteroidetes bacterium]|nr:HigA family addiction module antidote protein [Bacteroidota bacterium]